tara:strand:- start:351 stop:1154 length:804 start_codon:yes stop_codon:yes gene_type:complete
MNYLNYFLLFFAGASTGSFINLARFRIPRNKSIFFPRSFCDNCKTPLIWYQKVPILSQLFLSSKCRNCGFIVPFKYSFIEIILGVGFILNLYCDNYFISPNQTFDLIIKCIFVSNLFLISIIDIDTLTIPNNLNIFNYLLGIFTIIFFSNFEFQANLIIYRIFLSILTLITLELFSYIYFRIRNKIPFGSGDSKLLAVFVIWLGIKGMFLSLICSIYLASIYIFIKFLNGKLKNDRIPFGPFLCSGAYLFIMLGSEILSRILFLDNR